MTCWSKLPDDDSKGQEETSTGLCEPHVFCDMESHERAGDCDKLWTPRTVYALEAGRNKNKWICYKTREGLTGNTLQVAQ